MLNRWRLSFLSFAGIIPGVDVIQVDYTAMLNGANTLATVVDAIRRRADATAVKRRSGHNPGLAHERIRATRE